MLLRKKEINKPVIITFQLVADKISQFDMRCLEILHKMQNPSPMNIYSFAALVSLFAGQIKEVPGELLDEKELTWPLLSMFLNDVHKFVENLKRFKEFVMHNKITSKNIEISSYWLKKYQLIQWEYVKILISNEQSLSSAFVNITEMIIKLDKSQNYKLPRSPAKSLSASPSPLNRRIDDFDEIDEVEMPKSPKQQQKKVPLKATHAVTKSQQFPHMNAHHSQSQQIKVVTIQLKKK